MKSNFITLILCLVSSVTANTIYQQPPLTGRVTDENTGDALPGVNVIVEGTQMGTVTDFQGKYSLQGPPVGAIILFSYLGYETRNITYSGEKVMDIKLSVGVLALEEIVVVGYGTVKKSDLTGAVSSVNFREIAKSSPVNIQSALQGQVPGLMVTSNSGAPGSEAVIRIRGIGTINNNDPIYVVDGMLIDNTDPNNVAGNISFLNPADIASIEILKDASAQAIYGSRGANGVILITTKKGTEALPMVTFSSSFGFANIINVPDVLNASEFKDYILTSHYNGYLRSETNPDPNVNIEKLNGFVEAIVDGYNKEYNTDWLKEIIRKNSLRQDHNLSISGGTKQAHYLASAGYLYHDGLFHNTDYTRYSFRLNTDFKVGNAISFGENLGIGYGIRQGSDNSTAFRSAMAADPVTPVLKPLIDTTDPNINYNKYAACIVGSMNPVLEANMQNLRSSTLTLAGDMFAEVLFFKNLKFRTGIGLNLALTDVMDYKPQFYISPAYQNAISKVETANYRSNGWMWENTLSFNKSFKEHSVTLLLGYTSERSRASNQNASKMGTPGNNPQLQTFDAATLQPNVSGSYNILNMISYLGRVNYSFRDRYLLTASLRRDGSSKFGKGHRWGTFPSFSLGWKINEEELFKNLNALFISNFKIRAGWGQIGNASLPVYYAFVSQVGTKGSEFWYVDNRYIFDEDVYTGFFLTTIGTEDISWETTGQINFGTEIGLFNSTINVTADYYIKNTRDLLLQVPMVSYAGYPGFASPYTNAGSVRNRGFELLVEYRGKSGKFNYGATINISAFKNEVTQLGNENKPIVSWINKTEVGRPIGSFFGYKTNGIFQTDEEVQNHKGPGGTVLQPYARAGDFRFKNIHDDESLDYQDETWIGNPWPKLTYGLSINLGYNGFDLVALIQGSYGNDIYRAYFQRWGTGFLGYGNTLKYIYHNAWSGPGTSNEQPQLTTVDQNNNYRNSDYFVEDGSYLRLKNIQVGYTIPETTTGKIGIRTARIWVGGANLLTVSKFRGIDPETGATDTPIGAGLDQFAQYPGSREVSLGATLTF